MMKRAQPYLFVIFLTTFFSETVFASHGHLIQFIENKKQWNDNIRFMADVPAGRFFLENNTFTYVTVNPEDAAIIHPKANVVADKIRMHAFKVQALNANANPSFSGVENLPNTKNYFLGHDPSRWSTGVRSYGGVKTHEIYPGIDMKWYSVYSSLKYDFILKPNADASIIKLKYEGVDKLYTSYGQLHIELSTGNIIEQAPYAYQIINGKEKQVHCKFNLKDDVLTFDLGNYDHMLPLIIDPTLVFASYTGSTADNWGFTATYDNAGNLYSGGNVNGPGYPVTLGAYQVSYGGGGFGGNGWQSDMSISKFSSDGSVLLYSTYLGGSDNDQPQSLVVDANDNLLIYGTTFSGDFPTTAGAYDVSYNGLGDITVSKLDASGAILLGSTFVGGSADDGLNTDPGFFTGGPIKYNYSDEARGEIIVDANNNYIVGACSRSADFPTSAFAFQPNFAGGGQDGVVFQLDNSLSALTWSSYFGGSGEDAIYSCNINAAGDIYVAGGTTSNDLPTTAGAIQQNFQGIADGFIAHMFNGGSFIFECTYIGTPSYDQTFFVQLDDSSNVYTTGQTEGAYPVSPGVYSNPGSSQFIHKMNPTLSTTIFSTVFGSGSNIPNISPTAFLVDTCHNIYVSGWGRCINVSTSPYGNITGMPVSVGAMQPISAGGCDFYFFVLDRTGSNLLYASPYGGNTSMDHVDGGTSRFNKYGIIYQSVCAGCGGLNDFPTTVGSVSQNNGSSNCNNGVVKLDFNLSITIASVNVSASQDTGCVPLTVTFANNSIGGISYEWDFDDGTPISNVISPTHTFNDTGLFIVQLIAINPGSCNIRDTAYIPIYVTPGATLQPSFIVVSNPSCDTLSATITYTGPSIPTQYIQWNLGDGNYAYQTDSVYHIYNDTGTYNITLTVIDSSCGIQADSITQTINFNPTVNAVLQTLGPLSGCAPFTQTFTNVSVAGLHYEWNFGDGTATDTNYSVTHTFNSSGSFVVSMIVTDPASCNYSDSAFINVDVYQPQVLDANFILQQSQDCDSLLVDVQFTGSGGSILGWAFGDGGVGTGLQWQHQYTQAGNYNITLIIMDTLCPNADTAYNAVSYAPKINALAISDVQNGCAPQQVQFNALPPNASSYDWSFGDGSFSSASSVQHLYNDTGVFQIQLIVNDINSCNLSDTFYTSVTMFGQPSAAFIYEALPQYFAGYPILFTDQSLLSSQWLWDFGDGETDSAQNLLHQYTKEGYYEICQQVSNSGGCVDSVCRFIEVFAEETIYFPNVFSPDGDGINERFFPLFTGLENLEIEIFNRWGQLIYSWNDLDGSWDGTYLGNPAQQDVYVWKLKARGIIHESIERNGHISLIR